MRGETVAILPVKRLIDAKRRLASSLSDAARAGLMTAMLRDVAGVLGETPTIDTVLLVTDDDAVAEMAAALGAELLRENGACATHSEAAALGAQAAAGAGARRVICCAADCPLVDASELESLLARCDRDQIGLAIIPDNAGSGTNALVISPPTAFNPSFGPGSRARHVELGKAASLKTIVIDVPSLRLDLDTESDLAALRTALVDGHPTALNTAAALKTLEIPAQ